MKKHKYSHWKLLIAAGILLLLFTATTVLAQESTEFPVASIQVDVSSLSWIPHVKYEGLMLTVVGPEGFYWQKLFERGENPAFNAKLVGSELPDGHYKYEMIVIPALENNTREDEISILESNSENSLVQTGAFMVLGGQFVSGVLSETANNDQDGSPAILDQIILDDLIVDGSACVGFDCVNGESFGFDTIRLKENNLRIRFYDTSTSSGFPSNDWQITANDSASGGANKFSIDDIDSGKTPFTIEAGARSNALYLDGNRVGFGTTTPVTVLHMKYGDTPAVRLDQDGTWGWTPQIWDVAGNEANFFIRDATNGSKLPFRIQPGADSDMLTLRSDEKIGIGTWSPDARVEIEYNEGPFFHIQDPNGVNNDNNSSEIMYVDANGKVGIGTNNPLEKLHIYDDSGRARLWIEGGTTGNSDVASLILVDTQNTQRWYLENRQSSNNAFWFESYDGTTWRTPFKIAKTAPTNSVVIDNSGNVGIGTASMTPGAQLTVNGTISELSDFYAKENFSVVNGKEVLASLVDVPISTWSYKNDESSTLHMGPTAQDFSKAFGLGSSDTRISLVDRDGVALAAIQGLNEIVAEKDAQIADLEARLSALEAGQTAKSQISIITLLPWFLFTITLAVLGWTFGKRQAQKSS